MRDLILQLSKSSIYSTKPTERRNNALMAAKIQQYNDASIKPATTLDPKKNQNKLIKITEFSFMSVPCYY
ncbi:hypothetical protein P2R98_23900 [Escherichia coli]